MTEHPEQPPFANHRLYYIILKLAVLAAAIYLSWRYLAPLVIS
jgi:hypothetical protein